MTKPTSDGARIGLGAKQKRQLYFRRFFDHGGYPPSFWHA